MELTSVPVYDQEHEKYSIFVVINSVASILQHISGSTVLLTFRSTWRVLQESWVLSKQAYTCTDQNAVSCQNGKIEVPLDGIICIVLAVSCQNKPGSALGEINRLGVFCSKVVRCV